MAELVAPAGANLEIWKVHPSELRDQDVNARVMAPEMLERLADTLRREQRLESLPFTVRREKDFEVISGHHRVRAAHMAELAELYVLVDTRALDRSSVVAKQLAHNRIAGTDDQGMLAALFKEISRVDDILESYIRPEDLGDAAAADSISIPPISAIVPWYLVNLAFLPSAMEKWELLEAKLKKLPKETDLIGVVPTEIYERFAKAVDQVTKIDNVRAVGAVLTRMVDITLAHYEALEAAGADAGAGD